MLQLVTDDFDPEHTHVFERFLLMDAGLRRGKHENGTTVKVFTDAAESEFRGVHYVGYECSCGEVGYGVS